MFKVYQIDDKNDSEAFLSTLCYNSSQESVNLIADYLDEGKYRLVAEVDENTLDDVFQSLNLFDNKEVIKQYKRIHSMSIGDVIEDGDGKLHVVSPVGFDYIGDWELY